MESALSVGADAPGLKLIETLGWTGRDFPRLALHLARLTTSANRLGWPCNPAEAEVALQKAAPNAPSRMRLALDFLGRITVDAAPMPAAKPEWSIALAKPRLQSDDPWLRLKTTHRPIYDAARAALPEGVDEVIFQNERGEVCDGTITTLFFDRGQGLRTPPLACGLLPGVLRADLAPPDEVLLATDLPHVHLWVGNSLRGLIPASFILI